MKRKARRREVRVPDGKRKGLVKSEKGRDYIHIGFQLKETRKGDPGVNMNYCTQGKHSQASRKKHNTSQEQVERFSFTLRSSFGRHSFGLYPVKLSYKF